MSWAAFDVTWRRHASSRQFADAVSHATSVIGDALADRSIRWYAGVSGGKDSLALAWMLSQHQLGKHVKLAHAACELLTPGMTECAQECATRLGFELDVFDPDFEPRADVWDYLPSISHLSREQACKELFRKCASGNMLVAYMYASGFTGAFSGMRSDESRGRRANTTFHGELYKVHSDGTWMCNPISEWSARDVWAAVMLSGCRVPDHYRRLYERFGVSPESPQSRVDSLVVSDRVSAFNGAMSTARVLYPEMWRRIHAAAPTLAAG